MGTEVKEKKKPLTRFGEFELLKAIAIVGLPTVHVMEMLSDYGYATDSVMKLKDQIIGLCAFGPSIFMMSLMICHHSVAISNDRPSAMSIKCLSCSVKSFL